MTDLRSKPNISELLMRLRNYIPGENDDWVAIRIAEAADCIEFLEGQVEGLTESFSSIAEVANTVPTLKARSEQTERLLADTGRRAEELECALRSSIVAIDDWLHLYAGEFCDPAHVEETAGRVYEYGTIGYIAHVQEKNRAALNREPVK